MYTLGSYIGKETLNVEFKELRLNKLLSKSNEILSETEAYKIVNDTDEFVELCEKSLYLYIKNYIPKYFTSFLNNESINVGTILIGVSDFGEVVGFPIDEKRLFYVKMRAISILSNLLKQIEAQIDTCNIDLLGLCKIHFLKINNKKYVPHKNFELSDVIKCANKELDIYCSISKTYSDRRKLVTDQIMYYHLSINSLLTEKKFKKELRCFIVDKGVTQLTELQLQNIINQIESVKSYEEGQIASEKKCVHKLAYWITKFREYMSRKLIGDRPRHHMQNKPMTPYKRVINEFVPIIHDLFKNNLKRNDLYLISIEIDCAFLRTVCKIPKLYYIDDYGQHKYVIRLVDDELRPITIAIQQ